MINFNHSFSHSAASSFPPCVEPLRCCLDVHIRRAGHQSDCGEKGGMNKHPIPLYPTMTFSLSFDKNAALENQYEKPFWHLSSRPRTSATLSHNKGSCAHTHRQQQIPHRLYRHVSRSSIQRSFPPTRPLQPRVSSATARRRKPEFETVMRMWAQLRCLNETFDQQQLGGESESGASWGQEGYLSSAPDSDCISKPLCPAAAILSCVWGENNDFLRRYRWKLNPDLLFSSVFFYSRHKYFIFCGMLCNSRSYTTGYACLLRMFSLRHL